MFQYAVECSNLDVMPDLTFTINGLPYTLSAQAYTLVVWLWFPPPQIPAAPEAKVAQPHAGSCHPRVTNPSGFCLTTVPGCFREHEAHPQLSTSPSPGVW